MSHKETKHPAEIGLLVITDAAGNLIVDPRNKTYFRERGGRCPGLWKHVGDLGYVTFRLLSCGVDVHAIRLASCSLECSCVGSAQNGTRTSEELAIADSEAEWIEIAIPIATISLVEHFNRDGSVCLYGGGNCFQQHGFGAHYRSRGPRCRRDGTPYPKSVTSRTLRWQEPRTRTNVRGRLAEAYTSISRKTLK
jgi:hypothetical protein